MEYKYLLELLKSGMYDEFFADFRKAAIPFLDEVIMGEAFMKIRPLLQGSTAEFLNMWTIMMFGLNPFTVKGRELVLKLEPALPEYLVESGKSATRS